MSKQKVDKFMLIPEPIVYVEKQYYRTGIIARTYRRFFILFNVLSMLAGFAILTLSTLVVSKTLFKTVPSWYFYSTTVVTAFITLITSLINFFYIKDKYQENLKNNQLIKAEIIKHSSKSELYAKSKNPDFEIFHRVNLILGIATAKEVNDARS